MIPHASDPRSQHEPLLAAEAITLDAALTASTIGAARADRLEAERGMLRVGMAADMVLLSADSYTTEATAIGDIRVETTLANGQAVFTRA